MAKVISDCKKIEVKINVEKISQPYIDNLILGLVHAGYEAYFSEENKDVCFTGWNDDLITEIGEK
jgi:hypothetical protein